VKCQKCFLNWTAFKGIMHTSMNNLTLELHAAMSVTYILYLSQQIYTAKDQFIYTGSQPRCWQLFQLPIYRHFRAVSPCCRTFPLAFLSNIQNSAPAQTRHDCKCKNCVQSYDKTWKCENTGLTDLLINTTSTVDYLYSMYTETAGYYMRTCCTKGI